MNTVSNDRFNREITPKNQTSPPKGIGGVGEVFQTRFFGGTACLKTHAFRSAQRGLTTPPVPVARRGFNPAKVEIRQQSITIASMTPKPSRPPLPSLAEVVADFRQAVGAVVAAGHAGLEPAGWGRVEWLEFHRPLAVCRRRSPGWLAASRAHAVARWGAEFVAEFEAEERAKIKLARQQTNRR